MLYHNKLLEPALTFTYLWIPEAVAFEICKHFEKCEKFANVISRKN